MDTARFLEKRLLVSISIDTLIEHLRGSGQDFGEALVAIMEAACRLLAAQGAAVRIVDKVSGDMTLTTGSYDESWLSLVFGADKPSSLTLDNGTALVCSVLDCDGRQLGSLCFAFSPAGQLVDAEALHQWVQAVAEQMDDFVADFQQNAAKQRIIETSTAALRSRVFEDGADQAFALLSEALGLEEMLFVYEDFEAVGMYRFRYRYYQNGRLCHDTYEKPYPTQAIQGPETGLDDLLDWATAHVMAKAGDLVVPLFFGGKTHVIGKLVCHLLTDAFAKQRGDILRAFAECLTQRIIDYNREKRILSRSFRPADVRRLLREPDTQTRCLATRVADITILFADISYFTAISERILKDAQRIGRLINTWAKAVVEIIFNNNGVFDNLVGDCAIGLFGPPFFESSGERQTRDAVEAAVQILEFTIGLGQDFALEPLLQREGLGSRFCTASGIHRGPTCIGFFGPHKNYTGFSNAMNQTARLQSLAGSGQIGISSDAYPLVKDMLGDKGYTVRGPLHAAAKNVARPLTYYTIQR